MFFSSSAVAGLLSGIIAWAVAKDLVGKNGLRSWQWLFIVEGVPTVGLGIVVLFLLPGNPDQLAKRKHFLFRNPREQELILERMTTSK